MVCLSASHPLFWHYRLGHSKKYQQYLCCVGIKIKVTIDLCLRVVGYNMSKKAFKLMSNGDCPSTCGGRHKVT